MHVASAMTFDGPPPPYEDFKAHIGSRLDLVPRFRQRLRFIPFGQGRPVWVDDPHFNLGYHVRHTALPSPGSDEQLRLLAGRVFSQHLDRSKPLWEIWLVQGLAGGRFGIVAKTHHCLVDGVSGVDLMTVLFDAEAKPKARDAEPEPWVARPEPTDAQLLADALLERGTRPAEVARGMRALVRGPRQLAERAVEAAATAGTLAGVGFDAAPPTPFNVAIGPHRRIAWVRGELSAFKEVKNEFGGTVNDVVLAAVTGALGRYLRARGHATRELVMKAMVPVSVRAEEQRGSLGNRVSAMMAPLPVWCEDPIARLRAVSGAMGDLKDSGQAESATMLTQLADFAPPTILSQAARLQSRQRFFNLVVTNIPGPQFPLYVMGRRLTTIFPLVPLARRQALCIGIMSYDGQLNFGLVGDYDAMSDLAEFAEDLRASFDELAAAAGAGPSATVEGVEVGGELEPAEVMN